MACFVDTSVSQGSVATYARCGGIFNIHNYKFTHESSSEKNILIGSDWTELWRWVCGPTFLTILYATFLIDGARRAQTKQLKKFAPVNRQRRSFTWSYYVTSLRLDTAVIVSPVVVISRLISTAAYRSKTEKSYRHRWGISFVFQPMSGTA